jgi:hypothetical protein
MHKWKDIPLYIPCCKWKWKKIMRAKRHNQNWWAEQVLSRGLVPVGEGRMWGKVVGGLIWCKYCVHMCIHEKMRCVETFPGTAEREIKENDGGGEFNYDIFDIL